MVRGTSRAEDKIGNVPLHGHRVDSRLHVGCGADDGHCDTGRDGQRDGDDHADEQLRGSGVVVGYGAADGRDRDVPAIDHDG